MMMAMQGQSAHLPQQALKHSREPRRRGQRRAAMRVKRRQQTADRRARLGEWCRGTCGGSCRNPRGVGRDGSAEGRAQKLRVLGTPVAWHEAILSEELLT